MLNKNIKTGDVYVCRLSDKMGLSKDKIYRPCIITEVNDLDCEVIPLSRLKQQNTDNINLEDTILSDKQTIDIKDITSKIGSLNSVESQQIIFDNISRGDIFELAHKKDNEIMYALVISNNMNNKYNSSVTILPFKYSKELDINNFDLSKAIIMYEKIYSVSKENLIRKFGNLEPNNNKLTYKVIQDNLAKVLKI